MKVLAYFQRRPRLQLALAFVIAVTAATIFYAGTTAPIASYADCVEAGNPILDTDPPICRDGSRNFTGTPQPQPPAAEVTTNVEFEILVNGDTHSALPAHRQDTITTQAEWQSYWSHVHAGLPSLPPLLPVDFQTSNVVGLALGQQATTGYGLTITNINASAAGTSVNVTESTPTISCTVIPKLSNPYLIVRTAKLTPPVSFHITSEKRHCN